MLYTCFSQLGASEMTTRLCVAHRGALKVAGLHHMMVTRFGLFASALPCFGFMPLGWQAAMQELFAHVSAWLKFLACLLSCAPILLLGPASRFVCGAAESRLIPTKSAARGCATRERHNAARHALALRSVNLLDSTTAPIRASTFDFPSHLQRHQTKLFWDDVGGKQILLIYLAFDLGLQGTVLI